MSAVPDVFGGAYQAILAAKSAGVFTRGNHFKDPWLMIPSTTGAANISQYDNSGTNTSATVAFFTHLGVAGVQDQTDWASNTYKTIYSHTGFGLISGMIACTAGGAETTTFEITIDGVLTTITVTNANGDRAWLSCGYGTGSDFTTANNAWGASGASNNLDATITTATAGSGCVIPPFRWFHQFGVPQLRYDTSCLVRMKHSAIITNSTATSYSGVWVRKGIAA